MKKGPVLPGPHYGRFVGYLFDLDLNCCQRFKNLEGKGFGQEEGYFFRIVMFITNREITAESHTEIIPSRRDKKSIINEF